MVTLTLAASAAGGAARGVTDETDGSTLRLIVASFAALGFGLGRAGDTNCAEAGCLALFSFCMIWICSTPTLRM